MAHDPGALFGEWKFRPPVLPRRLGSMPMTRRLADALDRVPLVAFVAPAGSGKSTALAAWSVDPGQRSPLWVRLEPQDDDPRVLAAAFSSSIRRTFDRVSTRVDRLLESRAAPGVAELAASLTLDLDDAQGAVILLDDLHHLHSAGSLHLVESVLDQLGPAGRLVVASRVEPPFRLPQRRVRRQVAEFGVSDLQLDRTQVSDLLVDVGVHDEALAATIHDRSGGWAAAAVLLAARAGAGTTAAELRGSLGSGEFDIDEFLQTEVLAPMDPELRDFVLDTSLLSTLDVASCTAITGDGRAAELLEQVRRTALAERVAPVSDNSTGLTLRYHDRIGAFLRRVLVTSRTPDQRRDLHRHAAAVSPPMRAIQLLLEVGDIEAACDTLVEHAGVLLREPGARVPRSWLASFERDQLTSRPWLGVLSGLAALENGDVTTAMALLQPATAAMRERGDQAGLVRGAYGLAESHLAWGQVEHAAALIDELLALDVSPDERAKVLMARLWLDYFRGAWVDVGAGLDEVFGLALTSCTELGRCDVALGLGTEFLFAPRGAVWLADHAAEVARRIERDVVALTNLELIQAAADLMAGRIDRAQQISISLDERALELGSLNWVAMAADRVRLGVALATDDRRGVDTIVDAARKVLNTSDRHRQERAMYAYALARSGATSERRQRVRAAQVLLGEVTADDRPDTSITAAVLDAELRRFDGDLEGAESVLADLGETHRQVRFCLLTGLPDLERAAIQLDSGRRAEAIDTARGTLAQLAHLDGAGLLLIDGAGRHRAILETCRLDPDVGTFALRALQQLAQPGAAPGLLVPETGERLTARELDVLELVVDGMSNRSIADRLYIGERTVKTHMTSLMRKLGVTSRTAAIARCRELGIR